MEAKSKRVIMEISPSTPLLHIAAQYARYHYLDVEFIRHNCYCEIISEFHF